MVSTCVRVQVPPWKLLCSQQAQEEEVQTWAPWPRCSVARQQD